MNLKRARNSLFCPYAQCFFQNYCQNSVSCGWLNTMTGRKFQTWSFLSAFHGHYYWLRFNFFQHCSRIKEETVLENNFAVHFFQMAAVVTTPFDVIKTHRQIELGELVFSKLMILLSLYYLCMVIQQLINSYRQRIISYQVRTNLVQ